EMDEEMREKLLEQVRSEREALFSELPMLENPRRLRESAVKLDDLVSAIEEIISKSKAKRNTGRILAPEELKFTVPMPTIDLEKETEKLWEKIQANIDATGTVLFSTLTIGANAMQIVASFIALLFLVNRGKANAFQEEFFGEIFVTVAGTGPN
ncbi:MAG: segregation/condensation protein A, partial [archaeon]